MTGGIPFIDTVLVYPLMAFVILWLFPKAIRERMTHLQRGLFVVVLLGGSMVPVILHDNPGL